MPPIGLGTPTDPDQCRRSVAAALDAGYRFVDTAQMYGNERAVGAGIRESGVPREEVIVASKLAPDNLAADDVRRTAERSLDRLGLDRLDLLYVHWPRDTYDPQRTLPALDALRADGLVDELGVSNFSPALLDEARSILDSSIAAHQVECHPLCPQPELRRYAAEHDHRLVAYSPLGRGALLDRPALETVATDHDLDVAALVLAWLREKDVVPIPKSTSPDHIEANRAAVERPIPDAAVAALDDLDERYRTVDPDYAVWNDGPD
ncbi:MAG: aldo/keto reductase [Halosimplex sp.]